MRFQLPSEVDLIIPDQSGDALLLAGKALRLLKSVLNMEPGQRLNLRVQIGDHCLAFHDFPPCRMVPTAFRTARPRGVNRFIPSFPALFVCRGGFIFICIVSYPALCVQCGILPK